MLLLRFIFKFIYCFYVGIKFNFSKDNPHKEYRCKSIKPETVVFTGHKQRKKPEWVIKEIIRLSALMPNHGCHKIAYTFNRLHEHKKKMTACKITVYNYQKKIYITFICCVKILNRKSRALIQKIESGQRISLLSLIR